MLTDKGNLISAGKGNSAVNGRSVRLSVGPLLFCAPYFSKLIGQFQRNFIEKFRGEQRCADHNFAAVEYILPRLSAWIWVWGGVWGCAISRLPMDRFQRNFIEIFTNNKRCAYYILVIDEPT